MTQEDLVNGAMLYQQKWAMQAKIESAKSLKSLKAIDIKFTMADFSKEEN